MKWGAVVLAGGRLPPPLARLTQKTYQADLSFGGHRSLDGVIRACRDAGVAEIVVSAPPDLHDPGLGVRWARAGSTPIQTAWRGVEALPEAEAILFLPCDVPLLDADHVREFLAEVEARASSLSSGWVALGLSPKEWVRREFPRAPYRFMRFAEGAFSASSLYAASREALERMSGFLSVAGERRKSLVGLLRLVGWGNALRYLAGKLSLDEADAFTQRVWGVRTILVRNCHPFTTMDCDTVSDYRFLLDYLQ